MNREQLLELAKQADLWMTSDERIAAVERFAALVAAHNSEDGKQARERNDKLVEALRIAANTHQDTLDRDLVITLAREAGLSVLDIDGASEVMEGDKYHIQTEEIAAFAAMVAAYEREMCARIAQTPVSGEQDDITMAAKDRIAAAIRSRK